MGSRWRSQNSVPGGVAFAASRAGGQEDGGRASTTPSPLRVHRPPGRQRTRGGRIWCPVLPESPQKPEEARCN